MKDPAVFVQQLREVANWYEDHPDTPLPYEDTFDVCLYGVNTKEEAGLLLRLFAPCKKQWNDNFLKVVKTFPSGAKITGVFNRFEVCTKRVVGTKHVPRTVIEAHEQEIVEWDCDPILEAAQEQEPAHDAA